MFQYGHDELVEKNIGLQNIFIPVVLLYVCSCLGRGRCDGMMYCYRYTHTLLQ